MEPAEYILEKIEGEYATLKRTDNGSGDEMFIALALLPEGCDIGTRLKWENFEYEIL